MSAKQWAWQDEGKHGRWSHVKQILQAYRRERQRSVQILWQTCCKCFWNLFWTINIFISHVSLFTLSFLKMYNAATSLSIMCEYRVDGCTFGLTILIYFYKCYHMTSFIFLIWSYIYKMCCFLHVAL